MLVSNKGYGVFWDNYSTTNFAGNASSNTQYSFSSEAGDLVDYYFFYGPTIDQVIAGYRTATGAAPLFPKWAYGLFQSKDHYQSTSELMTIEDGYRNAKIPVDVIVQDWQYWSPAVWGSHLMDASRYPDPAAAGHRPAHRPHPHDDLDLAALSDAVERHGRRRPGELDNYNALDAINALYPDTTAGGTYHFYDTFNAAARTLVVPAGLRPPDRQVRVGRHLGGQHRAPELSGGRERPRRHHRRRQGRAGHQRLPAGAQPRRLRGVAQDRAADTKRVYILTRSGFAGLQRYGAGVWSGDINATQAVYAAQIPAGLGYAASGLPYWTTDIGGYFGTPSEELFTRWLQFGAFCPTFRIHGQAAKELYGPQGGTPWSAAGKANMLAIDQLRYRLMPYIYSLAWKVTSEGYTIMRPLVFDFQNDSMVYGIKDQYMFGPALLVNPVTAMGATSRSVYLPAGTWYDFWTGATSMGGAMSTASAPLSQIPLYVRAGSIVPMGPMIQYATESVDPLEIRVYKGQNGTFTLYEDAGDTYDYENGQYATINFSWDDTAKQLTIGARSGTFTGMLATRTFNVVFVGASHGNGLAVTATPDKVVSYDGTQAVVTAP